MVWVLLLVFDLVVSLICGYLVVCVRGGGLRLLGLVVVGCGVA